MPRTPAERYDLHGTGPAEHEVYPMPPHADYWPAVTDVPCPVAGCTQTVTWYEAGNVPGYRACLSPDGEAVHRFFAFGNAAAPVLVRDECCED